MSHYCTLDAELFKLLEVCVFMQKLRLMMPGAGRDEEIGNGEVSSRLTGFPGKPLRNSPHIGIDGKQDHIGFHLLQGVNLRGMPHPIPKFQSNGFTPTGPAQPDKRADLLTRFDVPLFAEELNPSRGINERNQLISLIL